MFFFVYNIASIFLLFPVIIYHLYRSVSRSRPPAFRERFGFLPAAERAIIRKRPVIWLHAVSVGESIAARPLLKALRAQYPGHAIVVSNTTETGRGVSSTFPEIDLCIYFPFDFLPAVNSILKSINPKLIIIMETEIWPNFTREATRRGIPVVLANGRISDRSFGRYLKFAWFFRHALQLFSRLCMQTNTDRDRIIAIGAPHEKTLATGNLKYDIPLCVASSEEKQELRDRYKIPENMIVVTAGSTHSGEEQHVITMYKELSATSRNLFLVLVPRHPERSTEVASLLKESGITFTRRTTLSSAEPFKQGEALLVDTIGEMMSLYALSDIAYVGGSLVPTGGHNLLEPASAGVVSVFGPHMTNFREITELVLQYGAGIQVNTPEELIVSMRTLVTSFELRRILGQNGLKLMRDNGGATERHMETIARYL
ncbi:MAG: 3-deoxy-D-manno-octulosonic acid transferase [Desulfuromonadaceae bacterium]|nr:3-deoxy-D-manno-octulosonic acid transferase [Desulfuromonadaceae bacterium]MDD2848203.1 3-deoxy-D-manno-octulosonic acid transferase [Desulfuromonadaceae bacterium]MDD4130630.1 3-deoxy-D-manno-octulosonic acid transferase [Desulfuromonadaceae bacterium]